MNARELRIGNLFVWSGFASMGQGQDVVGFNNIGCHNLMEPIPLTPEWLERFGFENNRINWRWHKIRVEEFGTISQGVFPGEYCLTFLDDIPFMLPTRIRFVHELQNLYFALTGEELTIKEPVEK